MRRERKESETAMQHYVKWYECASLSTFWPAITLSCRRAKCAGEMVCQQVVDAGGECSEVHHLSLSLADDCLRIISKPKATQFAHRFFLSSLAALLPQSLINTLLGATTSVCDTSGRVLALAKDARPSHYV